MMKILVTDIPFGTLFRTDHYRETESIYIKLDGDRGNETTHRVIRIHPPYEGSGKSWTGFPNDLWINYEPLDIQF